MYRREELYLEKDTANTSQLHGHSADRHILRIRIENALGIQCFLGFDQSVPIAPEKVLGRLLHGPIRISIIGEPLRNAPIILVSLDKVIKSLPQVRLVILSKRFVQCQSTQVPSDQEEVVVVFPSRCIGSNSLGERSAPEIDESGCSACARRRCVSSILK